MPAVSARLSADGRATVIVNDLNDDLASFAVLQEDPDQQDTQLNVRALQKRLMELQAEERRLFTRTQRYRTRENNKLSKSQNNLSTNNKKRNTNNNLSKSHNNLTSENSHKTYHRNCYTSANAIYNNMAATVAAKHNYKNNLINQNSNSGSDLSPKLKDSGAEKKTPSSDSTTTPPLKGGKNNKPMFVTTVKSGKFLEPPPELALLLGLAAAPAPANNGPRADRDRHQQQVLLYSFSSQPRVLNHQRHHHSRCQAAKDARST